MSDSDLLRLPGRDALTGALDRSALGRWVEQQLPRSLAAGRTLVALYLDLDDFHVVNERFGRSVGDLVLTQWVSLLSERLDARDVVARVGGNELCVVLDRESAEGGPRTHALDVEALLCRVRKDVRARIPLSGLTVEFSAGILPLDGAMALEPLLLEGFVRMLRGRDSWRAMFGSAVQQPDRSSWMNALH